MRFSQQQKPPLGQQINWAHPLAKGLVACWPMNEGSGDKVGDLVNGYVGTFVRHPTWNTSQMGQVVTLDGTTTIGNQDYINAGDILSFAPNKPFSIVAWIYVTSWNTGNQEGFPIASRYIGTNIWEYSFSVFGTIGAYVQLLSNSATARIRAYSDAGTVNLNQWTQCVATYNGSGLDTGLNVYTQGLNTTTTRSTNSYSGQTYSALNRFHIGGALTGNAVYYGIANGAIADVSVYDRVLLPGEIAQLYATPYAMFERRPYWMDYVAAATGLTTHNPFKRPFNRPFGGPF